MTPEPVDIIPVAPAPVNAPRRLLPDGECWITRERWFGALTDHVEVWARRPVRTRHPDGDVTWLAEPADVDEHETYVLEILAEDVRAEIGVAPETDLECIHVGGE